MIIPKRIFQIWIGPKKRPEKWMNTWRDKHPDWEYVLITNENIPELINQKQYDMMPEWAGKADILRYELLYNNGGVFVDADSECINTLDETLLNNAAFACYENEKVRNGLIANGYLGSCKQSNIIQEIIDRIGKIESFDGLMAWQSTGPTLLTQVYNDMRRGLTIYPSWYFIPKHYTGEKYSGNGKIYAYQHWGSTFNLYE